MARPSAGPSVQPRLAPFVWRGWTDFGCGALGDMGSYSYDTIFRVLKLEAPVSVEASSTDRYDETYPLASIIHYDFPARGDMPPVEVHLVRRRPQAAAPGRIGRKSSTQRGRRRR